MHGYRNMTLHIAMGIDSITYLAITYTLTYNN